MGKPYSRERLEKILRDLTSIRAEVRSYYNSEHMLDVSRELRDMWPRDAKWVVIAASLGDLQQLVTYYLAHQGGSGVNG